MFGYVNVLKDELKVKEYNDYRAYYCGLCHELGKKHNQLSRFSLNYDMTALAILLDAVGDKECEFCMKGCVKRVGRRKTACSNENLSFAADMNVLLAYYKLLDDIKDNHSVKALFAITVFLRKAKKVKKKYPDVANEVSLRLKRLSFLEESGCDCVDKAAFEFAKITECIFAKKVPLLGDVGFSLGRLVYIMDAYDDMDKDLKSKSYNPANIQFGYSGKTDDALVKAISDSLYYSLADTAEKYGALDIKKNREILNNIMYLGLRSKADRIIDERKSKNEKSL